MLKKTMWAAFIALALCLTLGSGPVLAEGQIKIAIIDLQKVVDGSKKGRAIKASLVKEVQRIEAELKVREDALTKEKEELEAQAAMLSPEAKYERERDLKRKVRDFQDMVADKRREMQRIQNDKSNPALKEIRDIVFKIGKEQGYTLILEAQAAGILYAPDAVIITDDIIKAYDATQ